MKLAMLRLAPHLTRTLVWLVATACAAHAGEATEAASGTADQFKLMIGSMLMTGYIYRGISYSAHQPSVATYIDAQRAGSTAIRTSTACGFRPAGRCAPDARSVRVRYRRGLLLLSRRARAGAVELLGGARDGVVQADRQDHAGADPRLLPQRLADRRLGHLFRRHALVRSAERIASRRRGLVAVLRSRALAVRPDLERRRRERGRRRASAAGLYQLARRPDVHLPRIQARPQLHRHEPLERELLHNDRRPRGPTRRHSQSGQQSLRIALGSVRRDVLGNAWLRHQSCNARPLTTSCASRFFRKAPDRPRWVCCANPSSHNASAAGSPPAASAAPRATSVPAEHPR